MRLIQPRVLLVDGVVTGRVHEARGFLGRLVGLMGRTDPPAADGLVFRDCSSIHTCFMRFPLDVVYVGRGGRVTKVASVAPWRFSAERGASAVIELRRGMAEQLALVPGAQVELSA